MSLGAVSPTTETFTDKSPDKSPESVAVSPVESADKEGSLTPKTISARCPNLLERLFGIDLRALAVFRILIAGFVLLDLGCRTRELEAFYTDFGAFPLEAALTHRDAGAWIFLSPYMYVTGVGGVACLFVVHALFALAMLVGWRTRLFTFLTWCMVLAIHARNPLVLHSGDVYLRNMLFWSLFLPLGARWSVDGTASEMVARKQPVPHSALSVGTFGVLLQIALMYWFTAILKTAPEWRRDFTAVYYALSIEQYALPIGQWLREVRWAIKPMTIGTLLLEVLGPMLAFFPIATERIRLGVVAAFLTFHLLILGLTMNIGLFIYIAAIPWVLFLPGLFWDTLTVWWLNTANFPLKNRVMQLRERLIDWRSRWIARRIASGAAPAQIQAGVWTQAIAAYFVFHMLWINITGAGFPWARDWPLPPRFVTTLTRTDQWWAMFAPRPTVEDGWYIIAARTVGGQYIDLFRDGKPLDVRKPDAMEISRLYKSDRWGKFLMNLWGRMYSGYRVYYCRYLDRQWHRNHRDAQALHGFDVYFMYKETPPDYKPYKVVPKILYRYICRPQN